MRNDPSTEYKNLLMAKRAAAGKTNSIDSHITPPIPKPVQPKPVQPKPVQPKPVQPEPVVDHVQPEPTPVYKAEASSASRAHRASVSSADNW